jgi:hypothetical protein
MPLRLVQLPLQPQRLQNMAAAFQTPDSTGSRRFLMSWTRSSLYVPADT